MAEDGGEKGKAKPHPSLRTRPTTGARAPVDPKSPALQNAPKTNAGQNAPKTNAAQDAPKPSPAVQTAPTVGRRPLVSKEAKEQAAIAAAARRPFYARIPRGVLRALAAIVVAIALVQVSMWAYRAYQRSKDPDELAVREQLYGYRFDDDRAHFANLDAMGPKAIEISIKLLPDRTPAELPGSKSTTTAGELAHMYLMHHAARLKVDPPAKATQATRDGLVSLNPAQWTELQQAWTTWFADVQAKGLAPK
jgi:hypothetical protein